MSNSFEQNKVYGIDIDIFDRFILLIKDEYAKVDEAIFVLENYTKTSGINIGVTNQRDVLSHFSTILNDPEMGRDKLIAHLNQSEEHLRRAKVESYEEAISLMIVSINKVVQSYNNIVLPLLPNESMPRAPDSIEISSFFKTIRDTRIEARKLKGQNSSEGAKKSIDYLFEIYEKIKEFEERLEHYIPIGSQIKENKKQKLIGIWAIIATFLVFALTVFIFLPK